MASLRIVALSDTHGLHRHVQVPPGDILVHAGDLTRHGDRAELADLNAWLGELPHRHKLLVAGNHDWCFEEDAEACAALLPNAVYLQDATVTLEDATFYGSPWTPRFYDWAFMLPRGAPLRERWAQIPAGTDVLITHGPPYGQGDLTFRGEHAGCFELLHRYLARAEAAAGDERNFVKKAISWALREIGQRSPELNAAAVTVARRLPQRRSAGPAPAGAG